MLTIDDVVGIDEVVDPFNGVMINPELGFSAFRNVLSLVVAAAVVGKLNIEVVEIEEEVDVDTDEVIAGKEEVVENPKLGFADSVVEITVVLEMDGTDTEVVAVVVVKVLGIKLKLNEGILVEEDMEAVVEGADGTAKLKDEESAAVVTELDTLEPN